MKTAIFLLFATLVSASSFSQHLSWAQQWGKETYDHGNAVATDANGNVYTTGVFQGTVDFDASQAVVNLTAIQQDIFIVKNDSHGKLIWAKQISGANSEETTDIEISSNGDVYVTGNFYGTVDFDPGAGTFWLDAVTGGRTFVCKLDSDGDFVWAKQFSGMAFTQAITLDNNGNVYAGGNFGGSSDFNPGAGQAILNGGVVSLFIAKLDVDGNYVWARHFGKSDVDTLGAYIEDVAVDADGNVYTTGGFEDTIDFDPGSAIYALVPKSMDIFISKLDASGNFVWVKQFGSVDYDRGHSLVLDADANIYTVGSFSGVVDFDPGVGNTSLTSGFYNGPASWYSLNTYLNKYDSDGNLLWAKGFLGVGDIIGTKVDIDSDGQLYTGGYFNRTMDLDPGAGVQLATTTGPQDYASDIFMAKLDNSGNLLWGATMGNTYHDRINALTVDAAKNLYIVGSFEGVVDFDPGVDVWELAENNTFSETYDAFLAKFSDCEPTKSTQTVSAPCNAAYTWPVNDEDYPATGIYHYVLANAVGCDSIITLNLNIPVLDVEIENINGTLTYTNPQPNETYQWVDCYQNMLIPGETESTYTPSHSSSFALIVTSGSDCFDPSECTPFTFVGLDEIGAASIQLYPNPVHDAFTISLDEDNPLLSVEVAAVNGQLVYTSRSGQKTFSASDWKAGIYLVKVVTEKGSHTFRVVKD